MASIGTALAAEPDVAGEPHVALYTMGPGDDLFSLFGHAALCVFDERHPRGRCYNYGTTDFSRPLELTLDFLRGRAEFWVSTSSEPAMVDAYRGQDRSVYRQNLPLDDAAARALAQTLSRDAEPGHSRYVYHHFDDNCATRLRDYVDRFTDGQLSAATREPRERTIRDVVREQLAGHGGLLVLSELLLGRRVDMPASEWQAMFLPEVLREQTLERLHAIPTRVAERRAPLPRGDPNRGRALIAVFGAGFGIACGILHASRRRRLARAGLAVGGIVFGGSGLALAAIAALSSVPELCENELLLIITPLDLMLVFLRGRWLVWFVWLRLAGLALALTGVAAGVLLQPILAPACGLLVFTGSIALTLHMDPNRCEDR